MTTVPITAVKPYIAPLHWKMQLLRATSVAAWVCSIAYSFWLRDPAPAIMISAAIIIPLLYVMKHSNDAKQQDKTDADVYAVVAANAIQCKPRSGVYSYAPIIVQIKGTRPFDHEKDVWNQRAAAELLRVLETGFCELSAMEPTSQPGMYSAHVTIRSPFPDPKTGHHKHVDLAYHLLRKGLLAIDRSETVTETYERCVVEAKKKGEGAWRYLQ